MSVLVVAPRLCSTEGHEFEHTQELARAVKKRDSRHEVVVLSGPQNERLRAALREQPEVDAAEPCFRPRGLWDGMRPLALAAGAFLDALSLRRALGRLRPDRPVIFLDSLDVHRILLLAAVRFLSPGRKLPAIAIMRHDPLYASGDVRGKYRFLRDHALGRAVARMALRDTVVATDSVVLREVLAARFGFAARLVPLILPGIWDATESFGPRTAAGPIVVAFVGQPRRDRAFELFMSVVRSMEGERTSGELRFDVVTPPGGLERAGMAHHRAFLESRAVGVAFEERWMHSAEFARQIARGDIVWAVCDPPDYYLRQTSGIFSYAFGLARRIVTSRGWAEAAVGRPTSCRFVANDLEAVVAAIRALAAEPVAADTAARAARWREENSRPAFEAFIAQALDEVRHA